MKEHRDACEKGMQELGSSRPCMGEPPLNPLGGDHSPGPQQRTEAIGEGGPAHPDDTLRVALQLRRRTGILGCWTTVMKRQGGAVFTNL